MRYMEDNDHMASAFRGTYDALAWIYADYTIQTDKIQQMSYQDIIDHYAALSKRLGYTIKPRERQMVGLGQFLVNNTANIKVKKKMTNVCNFSIYTPFQFFLITSNPKISRSVFCVGPDFYQAPSAH